MVSKSNTRAETLLDEIAAAVSYHLKKLGIAEPKALEIGASVAEKIRATFGGQALYIAVEQQKKVAERDAELFAEFTGTNHNDLASRYGISVVHVYRIVKRMQERNRG